MGRGRAALRRACRMRAAAACRVGEGGEEEEAAGCRGRRTRMGRWRLQAAGRHVALARAAAPKDENTPSMEQGEKTPERKHLCMFVNG